MRWQFARLCRSVFLLVAISIWNFILQIFFKRKKNENVSTSKFAETKSILRQFWTSFDRRQWTVEKFDESKTSQKKFVVEKWNSERKLDVQFAATTTFNDERNSAKRKKFDQRKSLFDRGTGPTISISLHFGRRRFTDEFGSATKQRTERNFFSSNFSNGNDKSFESNAVRKTFKTFLLVISARKENIFLVFSSRTTTEPTTSNSTTATENNEASPSGTAPLRLNRAIEIVIDSIQSLEGMASNFDQLVFGLIYGRLSTRNEYENSEVNANIRASCFSYRFRLVFLSGNDSFVSNSELQFIVSFNSSRNRSAAQDQISVGKRIFAVGFARWEMSNLFDRIF